MLILTDRGTGDRYVLVAKATGELMIRFPFATAKRNDSFRACDPLDKYNTFDCKYGVRNDGEYVDRDIHVTTY